MKYLLYFVGFLKTIKCVTLNDFFKMRCQFMLKSLSLSACLDSLLVQLRGCF